MQSGDLRLLVGLGNPGQRYASTRHNVGFMALEAFASRESTRFKAMANFRESWPKWVWAAIASGC